VDFDAVKETEIQKINVEGWMDSLQEGSDTFIMKVAQ
jgi:hypothetical protein